MKRNLILAASTLACLAGTTQASTVFSDNFNGNTNSGLTSQVFSSGATTGFNFWPIGTSGDMDAGFFSVVNKAHDVHSAFVTALDADNNPDGHYAIFNGFQSIEGTAYSIDLTGLTTGALYTFSASFISLAPNPPYPQVSNIEFRQNGNALLPDHTVIPVPSGTETWINVSRTFIADSGVNTLSIFNLAGASNSGNDFGIDNIQVASVRDVSAPVPLPAASVSGIAVLALSGASPSPIEPD